MIIGLACTAVMMMRWYQSDQGRRNAHRMMFHIPVIGKAQRESAIGRFAYALGTLLKGGSDIVSAIQYAAGMSNNVYIHDALITIAQDVSEGMPVYRAASRTEIFAEADVGILAAGEQTGDLPSGLLRLAVFYEKKNDHRIKLIATLIEPCLILSLGLVIGLIVVAMLMPIFEMNLGAGL